MSVEHVWERSPDQDQLQCSHCSEVMTGNEAARMQCGLPRIRDGRIVAMLGRDYSELAKGLRAVATAAGIPSDLPLDQAAKMIAELVRTMGSDQ